MERVRCGVRCGEWGELGVGRGEGKGGGGARDSLPFADRSVSHTCIYTSHRGMRGRIWPIIRAEKCSSWPKTADICGKLHFPILVLF